MKTLIFDENISGHHLEYLHHYYRGAISRPNEEFVFCLEEVFLGQKSQFEWMDIPNMSFHIMTASEIDYMRKANGFRHGLRMSILIARKAKDLHADRVILTNFMYLIPYLLFIMPKKIKVRGIVYRIYLHTKNRVSKIRYAIDTIIFWLMARSSVMEKVFILNDQKYVEKLNRIFFTNKFTFLPDPVPEVNKSKLTNLRAYLSIPKKNKIYFHFGGLTQRKGTLDILKAINIAKDDTLKDKTFIFAGRIYNGMHEEFYQLLESAKKKVQILVFDSFCEYDFLYNMCYTCDVILMPYHQTELSSGVLGYAAVFQKPVIGPADGLIGRLIKQYNMGIVMDCVDASNIAESFNATTKFRGSNYKDHNDVKQFINVIFE